MGMRLDEMERWLMDNGFRLDNVRGSHFVWRHTVTHYRITVATHNGELHPYQVRHIERALRQMKTPH